MLLGGFRFLLVAGTFVIQSQSMEATDKGKAAAVVTITHTYDKQTGELLFENQSTVFIRGSGGFGGKKNSSDRGSASAINRPPNRKPDLIMTKKLTLNKQLYIDSLAISIHHILILHFLPLVVFKNPILHGLCFFGIFGQHIYEKFGPYQDIQVRFVGLVYPGESIETYMWKEANKVIFAALVTPSQLDKSRCRVSSAKRSRSDGDAVAWARDLHGVRTQPSLAGQSCIRPCGNNPHSPYLGDRAICMLLISLHAYEHHKRGMATRAKEQSEPASHKVEGQKVQQKDSIPILKLNEAIVIALCDDQSGKEGVYLIKLLRSHRLPVKALISLKSKFMPSFSKMTWPDICEIWNQYKDHTNVPSYEPDELYIPGSFATQVFHAIEKAEMDTCRLSAATNKAKVVAWMRAVLETCSVVILEAKCGQITRNNFAQLMAELEGLYFLLNDLFNETALQGINEGKGEHHPSYAKWMQASQIANKAKAKALSAENEEDFMAVRHLLKKSFDSLPPDHNCDLRFPTQSNGILRCMEKVTLLKKKKTPQPVEECDILTAGLHCGQNDQDPHDATQPVMPQPSELANPRQGLSNR
ncbi:hypothetical protein PSTT_02018 [Puccinia striiformis]|uniref:Uncharacterized protein n=1 Tax=Puccinia striiformis TaxID=27350 RepID=A0A2S4W204_9BASI|nr:hypothetical protein PSTT_02018 [Puccinia striiformis]